MTDVVQTMREALLAKVKAGTHTWTALAAETGVEQSLLFRFAHGGGRPIPANWTKLLAWAGAAPAVPAPDYWGGAFYAAGRIQRHVHRALEAAMAELAQEAAAPGAGPSQPPPAFPPEPRKPKKRG